MVWRSIWTAAELKASSQTPQQPAPEQPPRREAWSQSCTQGPPQWPKALRGICRSLYRKGKPFLTKALRHENTHAPGKQMPHITSTEPIYRHGAVDIKAVHSLWGIPPFSSFKRERNSFSSSIHLHWLSVCMHVSKSVCVCSGLITY